MNRTNYWCVLQLNGIYGCTKCSTKASYRGVECITYRYCDPRLLCFCLATLGLLGLSFASILFWYLIFIDKTYASITLQFQKSLISLPTNVCYIVVSVIFILINSRGLIANVPIIFNTTLIDPVIVHGLFGENIATALHQTNLRVNENYTSSKTFILTHSFVNCQSIFRITTVVYMFSVQFNYILTFSLFSRLSAGHIR